MVQNVMIEYSDCKDPKWTSKEKIEIDLMVNFSNQSEEFVPFTASRNDPEPHGQEIYSRAIAGDFGPIADWTPPPPIEGDEAMEAVRSSRNAILAETDYIELPTMWSTLSEVKQAEWAAYRNALRSLPSDFPNARLVYDDQSEGMVWENITWPTKPT